MASAIHGQCVAGPHEDAKAADNRGDYQTELQILVPEAALGHAWAQNYLGLLFLDGNGVGKDEAQALAWFEKAAAQANPGGEINLGGLYESGLAVPSDPARAADLFRLAGEQGTPEGWSLLKRLCDHDKQLAPSACVGIPQGTRSAPDWDFRGRTGLLLALAGKLLLGVALLAFAIYRFRAAWKKMSANSKGETSASGAVDPGMAARTRASSFARFVIVGSVSFSVLLVVPTVLVILRSPGKSPFSPLMISWQIGLVSAWILIVWLRARGLRKH